MIKIRKDLVWITFLALLALLIAACGPAETSNGSSGSTDSTGSSDGSESITADSAESTDSIGSSTVVSDFDIYGDAKEEDYTTTESGLQYYIFEEGDGPAPEPGEVVSVHYTGYLEDGTQFDSSVDSGEPLSFAIGKGLVIPGWDEGISLLKLGDKGRLILPPDLGYGEQGAGGGVIPPNATLIFDVELVNIQPGAPESPTEVDEADYITTDSGLKYIDLVEGDGETAEPGMQVSVHYTGWLTDGVKFDSSLDRGQPLTFNLGTGSVIDGWDEGVTGMKVGGVRQLWIPADLAYGEAGAGGGIIPPNAVLIFEVELLSVQ
ncbi:MAG: FKBP-type peptidyl-prolyl cis-trans isomerase [Candidatus Promineifilaceae bacterium]